MKKIELHALKSSPSVKRAEKSCNKVWNSSFIGGGSLAVKLFECYESHSKNAAGGEK